MPVYNAWDIWDFLNWARMLGQHGPGFKHTTEPPPDRAAGSA
jgi:hypothetical protein